MNLEDQIEKAILDPKVSRSIKTCLRSENESGFLIYLAEDGSIYQGGIVYQNERRLGEFQVSGMDSLDRGYISMWSEFALEELSSYLEAYDSQNKLSIDQRSGLVVLTKWRIDECDAETTEILKQRLFRDKEITHPSILNSIPTIPDQLELNLLRKIHNNVALVRGARLSKDEPYARLLVMKQTAPYASGDTLRTMDLAAGYSPGLPSALRDSWRKYYQKFDGILDLDQRFLDLNEA